MMLNLHVPARYSNEVRWIVSVIFGEFLGIAYNIIEGEQEYYRLEFAGKTLELPDCFFSQASNTWLHSSSLPSIPLTAWNLSIAGLVAPMVTQPLPVLFGKPEVEVTGNSIRLGADIFGTAFFMLSRYEEVVLLNRDYHNRFPASASLAFKAKFLDRPIIDEYVEALWAAMKHLWPRLKRKIRKGKIRVTCDVDVPFDCALGNAKRLIRSLAGDVLNRHNGRLACSRIRNYYTSKQGDYRHDPYNTFDWYMDACEKAGRSASFYFIPDHSAGAIDGCYGINDHKILELIRKVDQRGHENGVHGSYNSYQSLPQIQRERQRMIEACWQVGAEERVSGNRQHYLRWDTSQTPDYLDAAGYEYDTTGSFADMPGFRYGTSRPFTMWSWQKRAPLQIKQRPLILMECSVIADCYMGLGYSEEAMAVMMLLKQRALAYGGDFTLLWHNSHLTTESDKVFFKELIA